MVLRMGYCIPHLQWRLVRYSYKMKEHPLYRLLADTTAEECVTCHHKILSGLNSFGLCLDCQDKASEYAYEAREEMIAQVMEELGEGTTREEALDALADM